MRTIDIDNDIYEYLRQQQTTFSGETASQVLRRLLRLGSPTPGGLRDQNSGRSTLPEWLPKLAEEVQKELLHDERKKALWEFIKSPHFRSERTAVGRFLSLLSFLHRENREKFAFVESMN